MLVQNLVSSHGHAQRGSARETQPLTNNDRRLTEEFTVRSKATNEINMTTPLVTIETEVRLAGVRLGLGLGFQGLGLGG